MRAEQIRNFVIISHVDHGKSTLADRFLELTKTISPEKMRAQFLDTMDLEQERGITIKLQPVRMESKFADCRYILNLIDTPGHVDFSYEVSRSLAAVEGAVLLVDASKGIQAQTVANLDLAQQQNLIIIPVVNKIDLPQARIDETVEEIGDLLKINKNKVLKISAKFGTNVEQVLGAVIKNIPAPPRENLEKPFRALIFDSKYDSYKGVIAYVRIVDGEIETETKIKLLATQARGEIKELGVFKPEFSPWNKLSAGEIGYIATGIKEPGEIRVGDTIVNQKVEKIDIHPLPGYKEAKPMVFASLFPENPDDFDLLKDSLSKLRLNDPSLVFEPETKECLGRGFRCGFLGTLHTEITSERIHREFGLDLVISAPSVVFKVIDQKNRERFNSRIYNHTLANQGSRAEREVLIYSASDWPDVLEIKRVEEPWVSLEIITPTKYMGRVLEVLESLQGHYVKTQYFGPEKVILIYELSLREIIVNLYDKIKSATQGYASMNYKILGFRPGDLVKMEILIAGKKEEAFSRIVSRERVYQKGKSLIRKLKETLPSQQFSVALQAAVNGKIIARETIKAKRKDVIAPLYGGDYTRKRKLLEKQKKGKRALKARGEVKIPPKVFLEVFRG